MVKPLQGIPMGDPLQGRSVLFVFAQGLSMEEALHGLPIKELL